MEDLFLEVFWDDYIEIVKYLSKNVNYQKRLTDEGLHKHKGFGIGEHEKMKVTAQKKMNQTKTKNLASSQVSMESFEETGKSGEDTEIVIPEDLGSQLNKSPVLLSNHQGHDATAFNFLSMLGKEDRQFSIDESEFKKVPFSNDWPFIMRDLCRVLTG